MNITTTLATTKPTRSMNQSTASRPQILPCGIVLANSLVMSFWSPAHRLGDRCNRQRSPVLGRNPCNLLGGLLYSKVYTIKPARIKGLCPLTGPAAFASEPRTGAACASRRRELPEIGELGPAVVASIAFGANEEAGVSCAKWRASFRKKRPSWAVANCPTSATAKTMSRLYRRSQLGQFDNEPKELRTNRIGCDRSGPEVG